MNQIFNSIYFLDFSWVKHVPYATASLCLKGPYFGLTAAGQCFPENLKTLIIHIHLFRDPCGIHCKTVGEPTENVEPLLPLNIHLQLVPESTRLTHQTGLRLHFIHCQPLGFWAHRCVQLPPSLSSLFSRRNLEGFKMCFCHYTSGGLNKIKCT